MLVKMFFVAEATVVSREMKLFAAQAQVIALVQCLAQLGQEGKEGVLAKKGGVRVDPANGVAADVCVLLPAGMFSDLGVVKLPGFPKCLAALPKGFSPVWRNVIV